MKKILSIIIIVLCIFQMAVMADNWVSPTGYNDPNNGWTNETLIYDGDTGTYGYNFIGTNYWGSYIELTIASINCDKIRFFANYNASTINQISVDVFYSDAWHNIKTGAFTDMDWEEVSLGGTYTVTAARIKFYDDVDYPTAIQAEFYEFNFNQVAAEKGNAIFFGINY